MGQIPRSIERISSYVMQLSMLMLWSIFVTHLLNDDDHHHALFVAMLIMYSVTNRPERFIFSIEGSEDFISRTNPGHREIQDRTQKWRTVLENPGRMVTLCSEAATSVVYCSLARLWTDGKPGWSEMPCRLVSYDYRPVRWHTLSTRIGN